MPETTTPPLAIATAATSNDDFEAAIEQAVNQLLSRLDAVPDLVIAYHSETSNNRLVTHALSSRLPHCSLVGASSCLGAMTENGRVGEDRFGVTLWGLSDPLGHYGVGFSDYGFNVPEAAIFALDQALRQANCDEKKPALIWIHAAPGSEEAVIMAINAYFSGEVPILGGSCADNSIAGNWHCIANTLSGQHAVTVAVMYPTTPIGFSFHSGYTPTETSGIVTRAEQRTVYEIDHQPAASVYNLWLEDALGDALNQPEAVNILNRTTLAPLGKKIRTSQTPSPTQTDFLLLHPENILPNQALTLFAEAKTGEELFLMHGSVSSLTRGADEVVHNAIEYANLMPQQIAGGLVIYCAGCMLTVGESMPGVHKAIRNALQGAPFSAAFTFGEQGCFGGINKHGNLMLSAVVFGKH